MTDHLFILGRQGEPVAKGSAQKLHTQDPFGAARMAIFFDGDEGFAAGSCEASGTHTISSLPFAEMLAVVAGRLTINGAAYQAGSGLVLPHGFSGTIEAVPGTRWFYNATFKNTGADAKGVITLDPKLPRAASPGPAPEVIIGEPPENHSLNLFTDGSGMRAGVWDTMKHCHRSFVPHKVHELMHLIEGEVELTHRDGSSEIICAGDTIHIPRGAPYAWKSSVPVVKYYCVK